MVRASTGAAITSGVTCFHATGTTRVAATNTPTHLANGQWTYLPTKAETNYDEFAIEFYHADAVAGGPVVQVVTSELEEMFEATGFDPADLVDDIWDEPQAGHTTAGTFGLYLDAKVSESGGDGLTVQDIVDGVWDEAMSGHAVVDSFGELLNAFDTAGFDEDDVADAVVTALGDIGWTDVIAESYAAHDTAATPAQLLYMIYSCVAQHDLDSTDLDTYKLDGSTPAMSFEITLNANNFPVRRVRTS